MKLLLALGMSLLFMTGASAQYVELRSVHGKVTDPKGKPVPGAIVYLTDTKTLQVRSYITRNDGSYEFHGLSTAVDYELRAEHGKTKSSTVTLSRFNSSKDP